MKASYIDKIPRLLGYHMPAEWEPHAAVWLAWPHDSETFPDRLQGVEEVYVQIIHALHQSENIHLVVLEHAMRERVAERLRDAGVDLNHVYLHLFDYADVWFRDYGPIFLIHPEENRLAMVDWYFNAWGQKYETHLKDTRIPSILHRKMTIPCFKPGMVLEGGSIDVNGRGTLITTEQCLLHPSRNPHLSKEEIESALKSYLGVRKIIWLKQGIAGDDTDGHVDDIARFVNSTTVVCAVEKNPDDENFSVMQENYERLRASKDQDGNALNVIELPMPGYIQGDQGRLPASYANFYIGNETVLVPTFGSESDGAALEVLASLFPDRKVLGILCHDLIYGLGALHCITQQQPALAVPASKKLASTHDL